LKHLTTSPSVRLATRLGASVAALALTSLACSEESAPADTSDDTLDVSDIDTRDARDTRDTVDTSETPGALCIPNRRYCISPRTAALCDATGDANAETTACVGATACEPSTGLCRATICAPDTLNCLNLSEYQVCAFDGSGYGEVQTCADPLFCAEGRCRACTENEVECLSTSSYRRCSEDATAWSETYQCPPDHRCDASGDETRCKRCDLEKSCVNASKARQRCTSGEVTWQEDTLCKANETCTDGECRACEPDLVQCLSETTFRRCSSDGKAWSGTLTCPEAEACLLEDPQPAGQTAAGRCFPYACSPRVLLLVDYSGSMGSHWASVRASVKKLVESNPDLRFGLKSFPDVQDGNCNVSSTLEIPFGADNADAFDQWFADHPPIGATPLAAGIEAMRQSADAIFGTLGGSMIVLSDGEDSCYWNQGIGIQAFLALATSGLFVDHRVTTYAIGYSYGSTAGELDVVARNGGSGLRNFIPAGSETELTSALNGVIDKVKFCAPPTP
jgi:hypothetical protein